MGDYSVTDGGSNVYCRYLKWYRLKRRAGRPPVPPSQDTQTPVMHGMFPCANPLKLLGAKRLVLSYHVMVDRCVPLCPAVFRWDVLLAFVATCRFRSTVTSLHTSDTLDHITAPSLHTSDTLDHIPAPSLHIAPHRCTIAPPSLLHITPHQ